jgi:hypothetical protein
MAEHTACWFFLFSYFMCLQKLYRGPQIPNRNSKKEFNERLSSGYFPAVWVLKADVSKHCVGSIFNRWWSVDSHFITCWRWNRHSVPKRRLLILRRRGNTQKTIFHYLLVDWKITFDKEDKNYVFKRIGINWNAWNENFVFFSVIGVTVSIRILNSYYLSCHCI